MSDKIEEEWLTFFDRVLDEVKKMVYRQYPVEEDGSGSPETLAIREAIESFPCPLRIAEIKIDIKKYPYISDEICQIISYDLTRLGERSLEYYGAINSRDKEKLKQILVKYFNLSGKAFDDFYKDKYYNEKPFREIWELARKALSKCEKLVVIGYSFSPSDFTTKQLFIESLVENNLKELVVVNPNHDLVKFVKQLCHFDGGVVWYSSLDEYLQTFSESVMIKSEPAEISETDLSEDTSPHDLYLKCKTCGVEFPAKIRTNPRSFATTTLIENMHVCPNGHANSHNKPDYTLRKVEYNAVT